MAKNHQEKYINVRVHVTENEKNWEKINTLGAGL